MIPQHFESKFEENYYKSVQESEGLFDPQQLVNKYLLLEQDNERLQRLRHKFGDKNHVSHLKSIHQSIVYENDESRPALNPKFHLIKNGEFYAEKNTINQREKNERVQNMLKRYEKPRNDFFTSSITNLPGPKNNLRQTQDNYTEPKQQTVRDDYSMRSPRYEGKDFDMVSVASSRVSNYGQQQRSNIREMVPQ
jgi:hypothetical protein